MVEDGKSGVLFQSGDSQDLRQKLIWLIKNPDKTLRMRRYGRRVAETRYSADAHYEQLVRKRCGIENCICYEYLCSLSCQNL